MKTFKFSLMLRTRENTAVFISLDDNIYGIHGKKNKYPLFISVCEVQFLQRLYSKPAVYHFALQSNFDGSNPFGTMKICSRQR